MCGRDFVLREQLFQGKKPISKATVADHLVERLIEWGLDTIFGFPGDGINGILEALRTRQDKLRFKKMLPHFRPDTRHS